MRKLLLACALLVSVPIAAFAGPKEDAFQVIEQSEAHDKDRGYQCLFPSP